MEKNYITFFTIVALLLNYNVCAQVQKGTDLDGEAVGDLSGNAVSMPEANTIAIGAPSNDGTANGAGHVRVYNWNGTSWVQKGADIDGEDGSDSFGIAVSMPDANTLAVGASLNDGENGTNSGHVRVFIWSGSAWEQKGPDIDGENTADSFGSAVSMPDKNTVAIGGYGNDVNGTNAGHVRIYTWNGNFWVQKGGDIDGEAAGDESGRTVSMPDANTVAIGAFLNDGNNTDSGHARVYNWNGSSWVQKGNDLDGEHASDRFGWVVSMPDANTLAVGSRYNSGNGTAAGHVRIFNWNGSSWIQKGSDIDGEQSEDQSGVSLSMPNANTIAIGANRNDGNGSDAGHVRVYTWNGSSWTQRGVDINGENVNDLSGGAVSMPDDDTIAIGASWNSNYAGHTRVYSFAPLSVLENEFADKLKIYPNPSQGDFVVAFEKEYREITVRLMSITGAVLFTEKYHLSKQINLNIAGAKGVYLLEITNEVQQKTMLKVIKE